MENRRLALERGFRPGSGAPKGNLNALKPKVHPRWTEGSPQEGRRFASGETGRRSLQLRAALQAVLTHDEIGPLLGALVEKRRRETVRFHALVLATAKLIHDADLTPQIVRKLEQYIESEALLDESENY